MENRLKVVFDNGHVGVYFIHRGCKIKDILIELELEENAAPISWQWL